MISPHFWSWLIVVLMFVFSVGLPIVVSVDKLLVSIWTPYIVGLAVLSGGLSVFVIVEQFRGGN